MNPEPRTLQ